MDDPNVIYPWDQPGEPVPMARCGKCKRITMFPDFAEGEFCPTCQVIEDRRVPGLLCWFCTHFSLDAGMGALSDVTPGYDTSSSCAMDAEQQSQGWNPSSGHVLQPHENPQWAEVCPAFQWHQSILDRKKDG